MLQTRLSLAPLALLAACAGPTGPYAELIGKRFWLACSRAGLNQRDWSFDLTRFRPPPAPGDQLALF